MSETKGLFGASPVLDKFQTWSARWSGTFNKHRDITNVRLATLVNRPFCVDQVVAPGSDHEVVTASMRMDSWRALLAHAGTRAAGQRHGWPGEFAVSGSCHESILAAGTHLILQRHTCRPSRLYSILQSISCNLRVRDDIAIAHHYF